MITSIFFAGLALSLMGGVQVTDERAFAVHLVEHYAELRGVDVDDALAVAWCESRFNNVASIYKTENSFGIFQEQAQFWTRHSKRFGLLTDPLMRKGIEANIDLAMRVVAEDGWKEWSCKPTSPVVKSQRKELKQFLSSIRLNNVLVYGN